MSKTVLNLTTMKPEESRVINRHNNKGITRTLKLEFGEDYVDIEFSMKDSDCSWDKIINLHPNEAKSLMFNLIKHFNYENKKRYNG